MPSPASTGGPLIPKRRVARELRALRENAELRLEEVAERTEVSTSTLSRLEKAQGTANPLTIRALVEFYNLAGTERGENLKLWAKAGRSHGWWQSFPEAASGNANLYVSYESYAAAAKLYLIPFLPVLLQTEEYSRAITQVYHPSYTPEKVERLVEFQLTRQRILYDRANRPPLDLQVILHESCLLQWVGSRQVMQDQLGRLIESASNHENIKIRVLPMNQPAHSAERGSWTIFEYADEIDQNVTLLETHLGVVEHLLEEPSELKVSADHFAELTARSLDETASIEFIDDVRKKRYSRPTKG